MIQLQEIEQDINNLPEQAQLLLIDFIEILKKRYSKSGNSLSKISTAEILTPEEKAKAFKQWTQSHKDIVIPIKN